ncbi:MAG TPA: energy transducer TonB [Candidatus Acidoferrales bacterium]|nr:energy transducer TonB [Candidatus Acidoferrales bacterium]
MAFELKDRIGVSKVSQTTLTAKTPGAAGSTVAERARNKKSADPVCIEMPVRVRGIGGLPIAGTNEIGQDFSEDTRTLIVMATGAVVRLATRVKKGQLLGLRHLRTEQEVSCRVINVRSSGTPEDYVEVEFTQRATGFWGIRFPNDPMSEPPVVEAAPTPGEVEAERVIFGGGHTERGNVSVPPSTLGAAPAEVKAEVKIGPDRGSAAFSGLAKNELAKEAPVDAPGFSGLSKSAEDALRQQQGEAQTNIISFPGPSTHQEKADIFAPATPQPIPLDFSPVEEGARESTQADAAAEHAAIARAIEEKAAREKAESERQVAERTAAERLAAAHAQFERIEAEKRAEAERKAAEAKAAKEAAERAAAEAKAAKEAAEKATAEKAAAEKAAAEKAAAEKAAAERQVAAKLEQERKEAERRAAERIAAAERTRILAEKQRKQEAERLAAEIAARETTDDVEVTPSHDVKHTEPAAAHLEVHARAVSGVSGRTSVGTGLGGTAYGTLEEEIQRDRAALKTFKGKGSHPYLLGAVAGAVFAILGAGGWWYLHNKGDATHTGAPSSLPSSTASVSAPASLASNANVSVASSSTSAGPTGAPVRPQPPQPPAESKKVDNRKAANTKDNATLEAAAASKLAKDAAADTAKPADTQGKPALKAKLSAPVMVKHRASSADVSAPDIGADPLSGTAASPLGGALGAVSSPSAPAAPPTGGHAVPPHLVKSAAAEYPTLARQRHIEGDVVVQADVDVTGRVVSVKAISGSELLRQAALDAVRQFKYSPAQLDGSPTTAQVVVTVKFRTK